MSRLRRACARFWLRPTSPLNLVVARVLFAGTALWVLLSRRDLPSILDLPPAVWRTVEPLHRLAYLLVFSLTVERVLFAVTIGALLLVLFGVATRTWALVAGLLLYHFAPLETVFWTPDPSLRGLTLATLGMIVFAAAGDARLREKAAAGWPLRLLQVLVAEVYWFAGVAKVRNAGIAWAGAANIRRYLLAYSQVYGIGSEPSLGERVAAHPSLCLAFGVAGVALELLFPLALVSRRAAYVLVPLAIAMHVGIAILMHIIFLEAALPLVLIDWGRIVDTRRRFR